MHARRSASHLRTKTDEVYRWHALSEAVNLASILRDRGFDDEDIQSVTERVLGSSFPVRRARKVRGARILDGAGLGPFHIREGAEPAVASAHIAAVALWERRLAFDFRDQEWERLLTAPRT